MTNQEMFLKRLTLLNIPLSLEGKELPSELKAKIMLDRKSTVISTTFRRRNTPKNCGTNRRKAASVTERQVFTNKTYLI